MSWTATTDRAPAWLLRLGWGAVRSFGWPAGRLVARGAALWFLLAAPTARRASADYLARVLGRPARLGDVLRHFGQFAAAVLDRVMLLSGRGAEITTEVDGLPALLESLAAGHGAILLGAHLGSFEILRSLAADAPVPVWALMYRRNAGPLGALLERLGAGARVLEIGDTASMIRARECVERGEIVGILADRAPPGHRQVPAPFLGGIAHLPSGPFVLAASLAAPVFLVHGVSLGRRRYRIGIEPFADRVILRRAQRQADLEAYVGRYAAGIERLCRAYPWQWFNFFPFWAETSGTNLPRRAALLLLATAGTARAADFPLDALMDRLAAVATRRARFTEERRFAALTDTLLSSGHLLYRRPDYIEKTTDSPVQERLVIEGARMVVTTPGNDPPRVIDLAGQPELRALTEALRAPLAGDLSALRRRFAIAGEGTLAAWRLTLTPRDPGLLRQIRLSGREDWIAAIDLTLENGDTQSMQIEPA